MDYNQKTIKAYEDTAEAYARKKAGKLTDSLPLLKKFVKLLEGKQVLEIGFGLGQDAIWFVQNGYKYTGVDPVNSFAKSLKDSLPRAHILAKDIRKADFPKESFDGVYAMAALLHFNDTDMQNLLGKIHKWLKKDGVLFVAIKEGSQEVIREDGRFFNLFTKDKFLDFTKSKFELIEFSKNTAREYNVGSESWMNFYLREIS